MIRITLEPSLGYIGFIMRCSIAGQTAKIPIVSSAKRTTSAFIGLSVFCSEQGLQADIQALPSKEVALIQLTDLLLGAASSRANRTLNGGTAKEGVVKALEQRLGIVLGPTTVGNNKFNLVISNFQ